MIGRVTVAALLFAIVLPSCVIGIGESTSAASVTTCSQILSGESSEQQSKLILLCQLHESAQLLAQLGSLVSEGIERLMANDGLSPYYGDESNEVEKRKHEYLRFGKRKDEYLRFGKRKDEYLRFGKRKHEYLRFGRK